MNDGTPFSSLGSITAWTVLSLAGVEKLFSQSAHSWSDVQAVAKSGTGRLRGFDLNVSARIEVDSAHSLLNSKNIAGIVAGSDSILRDEYIVVTAHLDHIGIKPTDIRGDDEIYNGAIDNASGVAAMLEVARQLSADPPKRSVLFLALTAEEKGLTGSKYFVKNPTVPIESITAVINLDSPIPTYDFMDVLALGSERSTMHDVVIDAVKSNGLTLNPDPWPELRLFTQSDHYSFVEQGIPSVFLWPGHADGGKKAWTDFFSSHLHEPSDEVELVDFEALFRFSAVETAIARGIADMSDRPAWKTGDFFGKTFHGPIED